MLYRHGFQDTAVPKVSQCWLGLVLLRDQCMPLLVQEDHREAAFGLKLLLTAYSTAGKTSLYGPSSVSLFEEPSLHCPGSETLGMLSLEEKGVTGHSLDSLLN